MLVVEASGDELMEAGDERNLSSADFQTLKDMAGWFFIECMPELAGLFSAR